MVVHLLWESVVQHAGQEDTSTMKRHRHTPEQIVRQLREGERLLNEGKDVTEVVRHLEIAESTWNRWPESAWVRWRLRTLEVRMEHGTAPVREAVSA
jgi:hypothetical protein